MNLSRHEVSVGYNRRADTAACAAMQWSSPPPLQRSHMRQEEAPSPSKRKKKEHHNLHSFFFGVSSNALLKVAHSRKKNSKLNGLCRDCKMESISTELDRNERPISVGPSFYGI